MYQIITSVLDMKNENRVTLEQRVVDQVVKDALQTIKNGLPEEAQTVEVVKHIIDEMLIEVRGKKVQL